MAKLKAKEDITTLLGTIKAGSVIDNISTDDKKITFTDKDGSTITIDKQEYISKFVGVPDETPVSVNFEKIQIVSNLEEGVKDFAKYMQNGSLVGTVAGLGFAFYRKSGVLGYIGYAVGFGILGGIIGGYMGSKKGIKKINNGTK
jgi:hypothetical protein